MSRLKIKDNLA